MRVIDGWPPIIDEIRAAFPIADRSDIIFSWGESIYAPGGQQVSPAIMIHERVHCIRQISHVGGVTGWWRSYLADPKFRLDEEILAHRAEFRFWATKPNANKPVDGFRSARLYHLTQIAKRLASPLYGLSISMADAKKIIERE